MSNLILFGAGASFGSDDPNLVPPLGGNLFKKLCTFNPTGWGAVPGEFARLFGRDFEKGMKAFAEASPTRVDDLHRHMAAYFFRFQPERSSLYARLAERIRACNWEGALASLNYERLLELSLSKSSLIVTRKQAVDDREIELCLPHGCCHLFINVKIQGPVVLGALNLKVNSDCPPEAIHDLSEFQKRIDEDQLPPVMCYFQPDKDMRTGGSFIRGQRQRFAELVQAARTVAIIGLTVRDEDDRHIWDPLFRTKARIIYCAGMGAGAIFRSWSALAGRQNDEVLPCKWAEAFDDLCSHVGIA